MSAGWHIRLAWLAGDAARVTDIDVGDALHATTWTGVAEAGHVRRTSAGTTREIAEAELADVLRAGVPTLVGVAPRDDRSAAGTGTPGQQVEVPRAGLLAVSVTEGDEQRFAAHFWAIGDTWFARFDDESATMHTPCEETVVRTVIAHAALLVWTREEAMTRA